jgi:hypothetical protein
MAGTLDLIRDWATRSAGSRPANAGSIPSHCFSLFQNCVQPDPCMQITVVPLRRVESCFDRRRDTSPSRGRVMWEESSVSRSPFCGFPADCR